MAEAHDPWTAEPGPFDPWNATWTADAPPDDERWGRWTGLEETAASAAEPATAAAGAASTAAPEAEAGAASAAAADAYLASLLAERMRVLEAPLRDSAPSSANPWMQYRRTAAPAAVPVPERLSVESEFQIHVLLSMADFAPAGAASAALQNALRTWGSVRQVHTVHRMRGAYKAQSDAGFDRSASRRTASRERARYVAVARIIALWYNNHRLQFSNRELRFWQPPVHAICSGTIAPRPLRGLGRSAASAAAA